jgi:hypothetical protein
MPLVLHAPIAHGFSPALRSLRVHDIVASTASHPNVRDDREPPLFSGVGWRKQDTDFGKTEAKYFLAWDWTTLITLNRLTKSDFTRTRFLRSQSLAGEPASTKLNRFCTTGESIFAAGRREDH